jgi:hypothetical protein
VNNALLHRRLPPPHTHTHPTPRPCPPNPHSICILDSTRIEEEFIWRVFVQVALALKECHRHREAGGVMRPIIHRDIKVWRALGWPRVMLLHCPRTSSFLLNSGGGGDAWAALPRVASLCLLRSPHPVVAAGKRVPGQVQQREGGGLRPGQGASQSIQVCVHQRWHALLHVTGACAWLPAVMTGVMPRRRARGRVYAGATYSPRSSPRTPNPWSWSCLFAAARSSPTRCITTKSLTSGPWAACCMSWRPCGAYHVRSSLGMAYRGPAPAHLSA